MSICGARCSVGRAKYRLIYEKMRMEGKSLEEIREEARKRGEKLSLPALSRHFTKHLGPEVKKKIESKAFLDYVIEHKMKFTIEEIIKNLKLLRDLTSKLSQNESLPTKKITALTSLLKEIRLTLGTLSEMIYKIAPPKPREIDRDAIIKKVLEHLGENV